MEHPGFLLLSLLKERDISLQTAAAEMKVDVTRLSQITRGRRTLTPDTAIYLSRWKPELGSPEFWLSLQMKHELHLALERIGEEAAAETEK